jgi:hypothetical protein
MRAVGKKLHHYVRDSTRARGQYRTSSIASPAVRMPNALSHAEVILPANTLTRLASFLCRLADTGPSHPEWSPCRTGQEVRHDFGGRVKNRSTPRCSNRFFGSTT